MTIEVTVIGGYLGAGKTTLLNHVLSNGVERCAVLVNDFGSVAIDESLVVANDGDTITLANGCICCSLVDGFAAALDRIRRLDDPPARLIVECSGVADPQQVAAYGHLPGLHLDAVVVVADAETVVDKADDTYVGDTVRMQLAAADIVVLNKIDVVAADEVPRIREWLAEAAAGAAVVPAVRGQVAPSVVTGLDVAHASTATRPPAVDAAEVFVSETFTADRVFALADIEALLSTVPDGVVRLKGIVRTAADDGRERSTVVQSVGRRVEITDTGPWTAGRPSQIVAVSLRASADHGWLAATLAP